MSITTAPIDEIDFDWTNMYKQRIAQRLPRKFIEACVKARIEKAKHVDYWTRGGNRIVGRLTEEGHIDFIINPDDTMLKKPA